MGYVQSDKVNKAEKDYYAYTKSNKPGEFSSEYTEKAKSALDDYTNHEDFKYDPATDSGYQAARKQYTTGGKQAMKDTLGTATELTGGYDNSYAQAAAQQTYNGYMSELASLMPQYEAQAYDRWQDEAQRKLDYYTAFKAAESDDYGKYRDEISDYYTEADRLYGQYSDEKNFDYGSYVDQRDFDEGVRQYNENLAEEQRQFDTNAAISQTNAEADYYSALAEYNDSLEGEDSLFYEYAGDITDDDGKVTGKRFYYDGKEREYDLGVNPYTNTVNPDAKNGTFINGYQPNNVAGKKLSKTDYQSDDNGVLQTIFKTDDGKYWLWNGRINSYEEVEDPEG